MIHSVGARTGIKRIAVRQEGDTAQFLDYVSNGFHIIRPEVGAIAQFTEMHFDCDKLMIEIDFVNACCTAKLLELNSLADTEFGSEIGKEYIRFSHGIPLLSK